MGGTTVESAFALLLTKVTKLCRKEKNNVDIRLDGRCID